MVKLKQKIFVQSWTSITQFCYICSIHFKNLEQ